MKPSGPAHTGDTLCASRGAAALTLQGSEPGSGSGFARKVDMQLPDFPDTGLCFNGWFSRCLQHP